MTMIKGRLVLWESFIIRRFSAKKKSKIPSKICGFGDKWDYYFKYWFQEPQKAHPGVEPHRLAYFASKSVRATLLIREICYLALVNGSHSSSMLTDM